MDIFLDDSDCKESLQPFTHTRHVAEIRVGIFTIKEKWEKLSGATVHLYNPPTDCIRISANYIPSAATFRSLLEGVPHSAEKIEFPWHICQMNDAAIRNDFELIVLEKTSQKISATNRVLAPQNVFIEEGATLEHCVINASNGPVYIGKDAEVMEGCLIRGPFALCENAVLKMGSKIYGATTLGPGCMGGGEIKNSVFFAHSNKAHDGYIGDSVIGEWCNLGAGTSNSNLKNTAGAVRVYLPASNRFAEAGNKAGLFMGDYSRCAINTSFNTGTVVGVCCNIFSAKNPAKYIENFSWGSDRYIFEKILVDIENWKKLKRQTITADEKKMLEKLYNEK